MNTRNDKLRTSYDVKAWQGFHVSQLAYIRNLIIVLSTALIGFIVSQILDKQTLNYCNKVLLRTSGLILFISVILGLILSFLESENYRRKYHISRFIVEILDTEEIEQNKEFNNLQEKCTTLETINKWLLGGQVILFSFGVLMLIVFVFSN